MSNPVVLITGALTGVGRATAIAYVGSPASVAPQPERWSVEMYGYLKDHMGAFGPHEIRTLVSALEQAWKSIQTSGATFDTAAHAECARAILAKQIIEAAKQGERDQGRLRDDALVAFAKSTLRTAKPRNGQR
jgi:NAD(P)-dependent dehydrogenase (short-subunit alcohol dehydrogenase family)